MMNYEHLEKQLLSQKGAFKDFPFGPEVAVFKVFRKMFALVAFTEQPLRITLKCDPDDADIFRSMFDSIKPGYHMNKEHWNSITLDGSVPDDLLIEMIGSSYNLVVKSFRKADLEKINI